jgi:hypothetical protein
MNRTEPSDPLFSFEPIPFRIYIFAVRPVLFSEPDIDI